MVALFVVMTIVTLLLIEMVVGKIEGRHFVVAPQAPPVNQQLAAIPAGTYFHRGHAWARLEGDDVVAVGVDDFARMMAGQPDEIVLPEVGSRLIQGASAWTLKRGQSVIPMLSPVDGQVVERNASAVQTPALVAKDPYDGGWLLKVKPSNLRANLANLLDGSLASSWTQAAYERLSAFFSPELGLVVQDGGTMADGVIEQIPPERLPAALREFFLVDVALEAVGR